MIDLRLLPARALVDTGVLIRAVGGTGGPEAPRCRAFFEAMESHRRSILVAAPSLAEYLRNGARSDLPRRAGIVVVAFDDLAAKILAAQMPTSVLDQVHQATKLTRGYIKYDALIVACAVRHKAEHIVSLDGDLTGLAKQVGIPVKAPVDYEERQLTHELLKPPTGPAPSTPKPPRPPRRK